MLTLGFDGPEFWTIDGRSPVGATLKTICLRMDNMACAADPGWFHWGDDGGREVEEHPQCRRVMTKPVSFWAAHGLLTSWWSERTILA